MTDETFQMDEAIRAALREDLGFGDRTTDAIVPSDTWGEASVLAKEEMILAGLYVFEGVFRHITSSTQVKAFFRDGDKVPADTRVARVAAPLHAILKGERTALNFLQRMSGIATATKGYVEKVQAYGVRILDTRKTVPGLRLLDKYAVRMGGGHNHRFGLDDGILIKDNHIVAAGSIRTAVRMAKQNAPHTLRVQVEVETPREAKEAVDAGAEAILADNMPLEQLRETVNIVKGKALLEASGGITMGSIEQIAQCGVDFISVGALTHSVKAVDLSLEMHPVAGLTDALRK